MKARENPFRVERLHQLRFRFAEGDLETLLERLRRHEFRGAIVGPHGSGKTTLLESLAEALSSRGLMCHPLRLNEDDRPRRRRLLERWMHSAGDEQILVLDGAEQLGFLLWRRVRAASERCRGLIITTHSPGRLPTVYECRSSPDLLKRLLQELLPTGEVPEDEAVAALFRRHRGNLRDCLRHLYCEYGND